MKVLTESNGAIIVHVVLPSYISEKGICEWVDMKKS